MHFIIFSVFICFSCIIVKIIQKVFLSLHRVSKEIRIFMLLNLYDAFARISLGVRL